MRRTLSARTSWLVLVLCAVLAGWLVFSGARALAVEGERPTIDNAQAKKMTEHGATLEAQINPQGSETAYEFWLECQSAPPISPYGRWGACGPIAGGQQEQGGHLAASFGEQTVSVDMTGLQPGYGYSYRVAATNAAGKVVSLQLSFDTQVLGACDNWLGCPYSTSNSLVTLVSGERETAKIVAEVETERRQVAREYEEWRAKEAARYAAEEAASLKRREEEEAAAKAVVGVPACIVPSLKGDTLSAARYALDKAHCRLGKVSRPRRHRGALLVIRQTPRHGSKLVGKAAVAVTLGR